jgi:hypothetical protein
MRTEDVKPLRDLIASYTPEAILEAIAKYDQSGNTKTSGDREGDHPLKSKQSAHQSRNCGQNNDCEQASIRKIKQAYCE